MENNEIVFSDFTRDMFSVPDEIHEEMLIDWLKKEVEIIKNKLIKRGYQGIGNHGFGMIWFRKGNFTYAIWPEDQENCQFGIFKIDGFRYSHEDLSRIYHLYGTHEQLNYFLDLVDKGEWDWIEDMSKDFQTLYNRYEGETDTTYSKWETINNLFNKNL